MILLGLDIQQIKDCLDFADNLVTYTRPSQVNNLSIKLPNSFHDISLYHSNAESNFGLFRHLRLNVILLAILLLILLVVASWQVIERNQQQLIEHQALELANVVSRVATSARSVYAKEVVQKLKKDGYGSRIDSEVHKGYVPLPAQFLKKLGRHASEAQDGLYQYRPISKWNLEPSQGLTTEFQKWAWPQLEAQDSSTEDKPVNWQSVWRIETQGGESVLRYLRADPASGSSCVNCHNVMEQTAAIRERRKTQGIPARQWRKNQLLGAIEVTVPIGGVEALANTHTKKTISIIIVIMVIGILGIGFFIYLDLKHAKALAKKLRWHAQHDKLTGLLNRSSFDARLSELLHDAKENKHEHALIFMDLDQFKLINDTCGHMAGDTLLKELSPLLQGKMREQDIVARLGGDEFGILLANCNMKNASQVAEKLLSTIKNYTFNWHGKTYRVGVSIGVMSVNAASKDAATLMSSVDMACYAAKEKGRNQVYTLTEKEEEIVTLRTQMEWPSRIHDVINNGQLGLAYQSAKSLTSELPFTEFIEVLIRLFDDDGSPIPTYTLIEAAERYNFMDIVDKWVINKTFQYIKDGYLPCSEDKIISINLSGGTINKENFVSYVKGLFDAFPEVRPQTICFEITETAAIYNLEKANSVINSLKEIGCMFALDDFGSGLSSLNHLKNLHIDFLKIDGTFISDIANDYVDRAMVTSVIQMGKALQLPTIAEWVETEEILRHISELGASYAQGYYIHKPTLIEEPHECEKKLKNG